MRLAVLMANTHAGRFARRHPTDGEKWRALLGALRPGWRIDAVPVTEAAAPVAPGACDGVIVTGSPASAQADDDWILRLMELIGETAERGVPVFGTCFGHQLIARTLGGAVGWNDGPFVLGAVDAEVVAAAPWMAGAAGTIRLHAVHGEQVTRLPEGGELLLRGPGSPIAGYRIGDRVFTCAYHPEMTAEFVAALTGAMARRLPASVVDGARASLAVPAEGARFGEWIARFFERGA